MNDTVTKQPQSDEQSATHEILLPNHARLRVRLTDGTEGHMTLDTNRVKMEDIIGTNCAIVTTDADQEEQAELLGETRHPKKCWTARVAAVVCWENWNDNQFSLENEEKGD